MTSLAEIPLLSAVLFSPLLGVILLLIPSRTASWAKWIAMLSAASTFLLALPLYWLYQPQGADFQFVEKLAWIPAWGASYHLGLDGLSLLLVLLTSLLTLLAIIGSWTTVDKHVREFMISLLLLEIGMNGVFLALDVLLFYVFWEAMLFPMYFLILVWGSENRVYAAFKFVAYTMTASVLMLVAIIFVYFFHYKTQAQLSFSLLDWYQLNFPIQLQYWLLAAFGLSFAVKAPMFPFHTWLPDAHVEAPTAGSMILAGVLLKMGAYGFIRFAIPLFPAATEAFLPWLLWISVASIIYGALVCMVQPDMKKLVAYSSVSHMGFVTLGIFTLNEEGLQGGVLQILSHGVITAALFMLVGIIYQRRRTKAIAEFGGLIQVMPWFSAAFIITALASAGLPGLNGFVGEYLVLLGAFQRLPATAIVSAFAMILTAIYLLWMIQRVFFGRLSNPKNKSLLDLTWLEITVLTPLLLLMIWVGIYPQPLLNRLEPTSQRLVNSLSERQSQINPIPARTPTPARTLTLPFAKTLPIHPKNPERPTEKPLATEKPTEKPPATERPTEKPLATERPTEKLPPTEKPTEKP